MHRKLDAVSTTSRATFGALAWSVACVCLCLCVCVSIDCDVCLNLVFMLQLIFEVVTCEIPYRAEGIDAWDLGEHIRSGQRPQHPIGRVSTTHQVHHCLCVNLSPH